MPKLVVQHGYEEIRDFPLPQGETTIGRSSDCGLILANRGVSRHHAKITTEPGRAVIEDMGSHNGTFVNSHIVIESTRMKHMDVIQVGEIMLVYDEYEDEELPSGEWEAKLDLEFLQRAMHKLHQNICQVIRGKEEAIKRVVIGLLSDGHVLLEDVPGVGKTMLAHSLAKSVRGDFKRIQFTPDMLPTDVTGVNIYDEATKQFRFVPGPLFANVVLADEINRGTPRTQSSLLECMSESAVTVEGQTHVLQRPFFVIATQNPSEFRGTYPLPEAQLDRFLIRLGLGYPEPAVEREILGSQVTSHPINDISAVIRTNDVLKCQALARTVHVSERVKDYIVTIVEETRKEPAFLYGCSTRASLALMRVGQSLAAFNGRDHVLLRDIRDMAVCTLSHRLALKLQARAEYEGTEQVIEAILEKLPLGRWES